MHGQARPAAEERPARSPIPPRGPRASRLTRHRDLVRELVVKEFKVRYKSTLLGYLWSILNPLAFALVFYVVFGRVVPRSEEEDYFLYLITGLFPWQWLANSLIAGNGFFLQNASLIKKVAFPRAFLVLAGVLNDLIHFVVSLPVIAVFMAAGGELPRLSWLWQVPLVVLVQLAFTYGLSLAIATANLFFRDLERIVGIVVLLWFYLTPIIYTPEMVDARWSALFEWNPMANLVACWRGLLRDGELPLALLGRASLWGLACAWLATLYYRRLRWRFAEIV